MEIKGKRQSGIRQKPDEKEKERENGESQEDDNNRRKARKNYKAGKKTGRNEELRKSCQ